MQEPPPCEETLHFDTVKSTVHTVPLRLFHLFSHQYKLLRSCSDLDGRNYSSQTPIYLSEIVTLATVCNQMWSITGQQLFFKL